MLRVFIATLTILGISTLSSAQDAELPEAPKPPKSKQGTAQQGANSAKGKESVEKESVDPGAGNSASGDGVGLRDLIGSGNLPRPRRVRINVPFFQMDIDLSRGRGMDSSRLLGGPRGESVTPSSSAPAGKSDDWRYRWHEGRWWYWMPSERWVYWDGAGWIDPKEPEKRIAAAEQRSGEPRGNSAGPNVQGLNLRNLQGANLQELLKSDEIRIGNPRRGNVDLEFDGVPPVRFGF